jgi:hypothetical protein
MHEIWRFLLPPPTPFWQLKTSKNHFIFEFLVLVFGEISPKQTLVRSSDLFIFVAKIRHFAMKKKSPK